MLLKDGVDSKTINMKNIFKVSLVLLMMYSCSSSKNRVIIPYTLDIGVEKLIYQEIVNKTNVAFYLQAINDSQFKLSLINSTNNDFSFSNRMIFINDRFYPLIFESDYIFYSKIKDNRPIVSYEIERNKYKEIPLPTIERREKELESFGYPQKRMIIDKATFWIIDKKRKLVSESDGN